MRYKISLILRYFLYTENGVFRKSYLFQITTVYIGALIISLTLSIMDGMQNQIFNKVSDFNYRYRSEHYIEEPANIGFSEIARMKFKGQENIINTYGYQIFEDYRNKINNHILYSSSDLSTFIDNRVMIGKSLSKEYNINLGDTIILEDIVNINIVSGKFNSAYFIVSDIYEFPFLNYDLENVFIEHNGFLFNQFNPIYYYDSEEILIASNYNFKENMIEYIDLFSAINFEKKVYILIGLIGILISSIIIFNNTMLVLIEKIKQFQALLSIGFNRISFVSLCMFNNIILSAVFSLLGLFSTFLLYIINKEYGFLDSIFINTPFDTLPILLSFSNFSLTFILIIAISALSTYLSIINMENKIINKTL
ncbi:MAG: hypothetical protein CMG66_01160 [Candidatus Marinimicrobia bacterium]|nr:hypothetical protein [Candidatus Neomarinimicrobiota bacterium]|tara:strand:- start:23423 stop:24520 length:1098 start_codon:yes stop_codon:yes gene_type:complete